MNLRCTYCQTPFTLARSEMLGAIVKMNKENLNAYDAHCPRCRRANSISRQRMELFFPNWQDAAKQMPNLDTEKISEPISQPTRLVSQKQDNGQSASKKKVISKKVNTKQTKSKRPLQVFLCHASEDKSVVEKFYRRLALEENIEPWLASQKLLPGMNWDLEIRKAVKNSDAVIVFLSKKSINKEGYLQKEIRYVLDIADEKPDHAIFIIPVKIEDCDVPDRLQKWHHLDLSDKNAYKKILLSFDMRAQSLGIKIN